MAFQVAWTENAKENVRDITTHLIDAWGDKIAEKFTDDLIHATSLLEKMPYMGKPHSELSSVRQLIVKPYSLLYYTVFQQFIIILNLVDSRGKIS